MALRYCVWDLSSPQSHLSLYKAQWLGSHFCRYVATYFIFLYVPQLFFLLMPLMFLDLFAFIGEWWNRNPINVVNQETWTRVAPKVSNAFTIYGKLGDFNFRYTSLHLKDQKSSTISELNDKYDPFYVEILANGKWWMQIPFASQ